MISLRDAIERKEDERLCALIAADVGRLDQLLSDGLIFVHPNGRVDSKANYLANLAVRNPYLDIKVVERTITAAGGMGVVTCELELLVLRDPPAQNVSYNIRGICVWAQDGADLRMIRYQSTFIGGANA
ncbi:nuclear transport factor 2 family protein [Sphingobium sp. SCG-1]|uniref:nuclear transport factor 2 family protein n=1 Tax=Sphingobium sp. SCG-1 TaxID=2072936 RepID=UPI001670DDF2|nr:nuclear transport factor 2 family protein [Sphingobium sp. SCG-1]